MAVHSLSLLLLAAGIVVAWTEDNLTDADWKVEVVGTASDKPVEEEMDDGDLDTKEMDGRNLRTEPKFCRENVVPKDQFGHLNLKEAKKCWKCTDRLNTACHKPHVFHGEYCETQCPRGHHPAVTTTQCLNGHFHPHSWHCLRDHQVWEWCPSKHRKDFEDVPWCIHANTQRHHCSSSDCCWLHGRGCVMKHFSSSSSYGAIVLWVLLGLLLVVAGGVGVYFLTKKKKKRSRNISAVE